MASCPWFVSVVIGATRATARFHSRSAAACRGAASSWGKPLGSWALRWDGRPRCRPQPLCLWQLPLVGCGASSQQEVEGEARKGDETTKVSLPPSCLSSILSPQQPRGHCHTNLSHLSCHPPFLGVSPLPGDIPASSLFPKIHQSWSNRRLGGAMQPPSSARKGPRRHSSSCPSRALTDCK